MTQYTGKLTKDGSRRLNVPVTKVIFEQIKNDNGTFAWNIYGEDGRYLGSNLSITGKDAGIENIKEIQ